MAMLGIAKILRTTWLRFDLLLCLQLAAVAFAPPMLAVAIGY
jgi:hypothetical protein